MNAIASQMITWEKLIEADTVIPELAPDEMTIGMYAQKTGLKRSRASMRLKELYEQGILTRRKYFNHSWVYAPVKAEAVR